MPRAVCIKDSIGSPAKVFRHKISHERAGDSLKSVLVVCVNLDRTYTFHCRRKRRKMMRQRRDLIGAVHEQFHATPPCPFPWKRLMGISFGGD
jgi:hypothetical protein